MNGNDSEGKTYYSEQFNKLLFHVNLFLITICFIQVPIGCTFTRLDDQDSTNVEFAGDLQNEGDIFIAARGGAGGLGNEYFANPLDTVPKRAEYGGKVGEFYLL